MCLDDGRNLALKTANLLEIDTREFLDGSSITVSLVGAPITPPRLYPPSPLTVSSQVKVVGLAQSVQYNGLRGCIAGHAKPGSVYIEYPPCPLTLSSQAKVVGPKTESRSNPKAKSRSLTKPGLSKMREPSYCARGPNTGCS